jgi:hypothetical protein
MKTPSRWLLIFGVAIGVLAIAAVVLVLTLPSPRLLPEDMPEGIVQRYFLALQAEDYATAYGYLSSATKMENPYESWREYAFSSGDKPEWKVTLGKSVVEGRVATVDVVVDVFGPGGAFQSAMGMQHINFVLVKEGTSWKINSPWYPPWFIWWPLY